jgi:hypothetical protein
MAENLKMAEKLVIDQKSVSFDFFCVLIFDLGLYFDGAYFIEEKVIRFKMAYGGQDCVILNLIKTILL